MGYLQAPWADTPDRQDLPDGRQHERETTDHRRNHLGRPRRAGRFYRHYGLWLTDLHHASKSRDRTCRHRHDSIPCEPLRLSFGRRDLLDCRQGRGMGDGPRWQGTGQQGHSVGGPQDSGRIYLRTRQPGQDHQISPGRSRELPLCAGRHLLRPRAGMVFRRRCGILFPRSIQSS